MDDNKRISVLSKYAMSLSGPERQRYEEKISGFESDPYLLKFDEQSLPTNVTFFEILQYLVNKKSYYTSNELKAFKSLEAYKLYKSGWVQYLAGKKHQNAYIVFGKVLHSQSLNLPPLKVWTHHDVMGFIHNGHCTCVAGLGECCSHVGAVLFALHEVYKRILLNGSEAKSVTDVKAYWMVPSCKSALQLCKENINYSVTDQIKTGVNDSATRPNKKIKQATKSDMISMLTQIKSKGKNSVAALGLEVFLPSTSDTTGDFELANLWSIDNENKTLEQLMDQYHIDYFQMDEEKVNLIQQATQCQATGDYWHKLRLGRITASIFKRVCRVNMEKQFPMGLWGGCVNM